MPIFILFDEAWQFLQDQGGKTGAVSRIVDEGFRRARKYYGSFGIVTQSIRDMPKFGDVGDVILTSTNFKYLLSAPDYEKASKEGIIDYDEFTMILLKSVKSMVPRYTEIFIDGQEATGVGVARLVLDPYSYFLFTSNPADNKRISEIVKRGATYEQAIEHLARAA